MYDPPVTGLRQSRLAVLALAMLLPSLGSASDAIAVGIRTQPDAPISHVRMVPGQNHWMVRGRLRLLPDPLPRSNPGGVVWEVVDAGRTVAQGQAVVYRVVTANRRARLFHFRAQLPHAPPPGSTLRILHLSAAR